MIVIIAQFEFLPETREAMTEIARMMDAQTPMEAGCIHYRHASDVSDPNRLILSEVWRSADDLREHFRSEHFRTFQKTASTLGVRSRVMQVAGAETERSAPDHWRSLLSATA
jgi:quinol monooxygenase YgiN